MHESCRGYFIQNNRRFLIIIFKDEKGYLLKVFLQREAVYQFRFEEPDAVAREVFSLIEKGVASAEDIDKAFKFGPAFR